MKKLLTILTVALMVVAVCSSCNKPKNLAKKTVKAVDELLDDVDDILEDFEKLTPQQKEEFVEYLVQQDWQETAGKLAKLGVKAVRIAGTVKDMEGLEDAVNEAVSSNLLGFGNKNKRNRHRDYDDYDGYYKY